MNAGTIINKLGKYLYKNVEGTYKIAFSPMQCEVYAEIKKIVSEDLELTKKIVIDIVSYQNKIRINMNELGGNEKTICQIILKDNEAENIDLGRKKALAYILKAISKMEY